MRLQAKVRELEEEVARREALISEAESPDTAELVRGIGMVKFGDEPYEPRFVGTSSGITMTRLVLDFAKKHLETDSVKEMSEQHHSEFRHAQRIDSFEKSPSPQYPTRVAYANTKLPTREVTNRLVEIYCQKGNHSLLDLRSGNIECC